MTQLHPGTTTVPDPAGARVEADLALAEDRLGRFFSEREGLAGKYGSDYARLWQSARDAADGGKRIRPRLLLTAHRALAGTATDDAVTLAVAYELLHTAFLLHDDVIDGDTVRRGRPNLPGAFAAAARADGAPGPRARLWGESAAILAGDLLLHAAASLTATVEASSAVRARLIAILDEAVFVTAAGELSDVAFSAGLHRPELRDVLAMTEHKTAAYSVGAPLRAGAVLAGAGPGVEAVLGEYGRLVGVAFQLGDDLLGVFGQEDVTGKSVVSDLRQGKETSLIAFARRTSVWPAIAPILGREDLGAGDADRLARTLEDCGARGFVERLLAEHVEAAEAVLDDPELPGSLVAELSAVARSCIGRLS
ncbi:polyprenyl synthetase family protein [Leifsonia sp. AG29]|uniref:polyprenyl synthetase family protein n=1 Tax=Leifsonia sp. AG29 TaxID=2598860 RepID=UPI00131C1FCB|nr:polyprenyl synthetase family protein [Leifsonia sp. AG29]